MIRALTPYELEILRREPPISRTDVELPRDPDERSDMIDQLARTATR